LDRSAGGITRLADLNGNSISITASGIISSTGKSVLFTRDAENRISLITDPMGNTLSYEYSPSGDLSAFVDQMQNRTTFDYDLHHNLTEIHDPLGNRAVKSVYDPSGRLISTTDAEGHSTIITHNTSAHLESVQDRRGSVTVFGYDADGNVISKIDALQNHWHFTFDSRGNQLTMTDPLGRTSTTAYDTMNNVVAFTSVDGDTTRFARDARGHVLSSTDARGRVVHNTYDGSGNLLLRVDNSPATTSFSYDGAGNVLSATDALNHVTHYTVDAFGNQTSATDPLGHSTFSTFDGLNRRTSMSRTRTLPNGAAETITTRYAYNAAGKPTVTTDPYGNTTVVDYNALLKPSAVTAKNGAKTIYTFNDLGLVSRIDYSDSSFELRTYDENGNVATETDRGGETTVYLSDALNRRTRSTHSDGSYTETTFDPVGRVLTSRDENGNITRHAYATHQETITDALANVTVKDLDADGSVIRVTDANFNVTRFTFDLGVAGEGAGRLIRSDLPGGAFTANSFDVDGRKTSERDADGNTTGFGYDDANRLTSVTDALGHSTGYGYDEVANRISITDAKGHVTQFEFDRLGRKTARVLPLGERETFEFDVMGNVNAHVDFNGARTIFSYDSQNRMTSRTFPSQQSDLFTYAPRGERLTAGAERFTYDLRGRMRSNTKADGTVIAYGVDTVGNRTSITDPHGTTSYTFDPLNRVATMQDPELGVYAYGYDPVGNVASIALPNGIGTSRTYDPLNHLTGITSRNRANTVLASYTYSPSPAGRQAGVVEAHLGRSVAWGYDGAGRLTSEAITDPANGSKTLTYVFDAVGNRSTKIDSVAGTTTYVVDADDHLSTETSPAGTTTYSSDSNGNVLTKVEPDGSETDFAYDARNLQTSAMTSGNIGFHDFEYRYDVDGARTASILDGVGTFFLVDRNRDNAQVLRETDDSGAESAHHAFGRDEILSRNSSTDGVQYMLYDAQRSVRQLASPGGAITDRYTFDAWGNSLAGSGASTNEYRYSGEQADAETGLVYLRSRRYDSRVGRFTGRDLGPQIQAREVTAYSYAGGDSVNRRDPDGRQYIGVDVAEAIYRLSLGLKTSFTGGLLGKKNQLVAGAVVVAERAFGALSPGIPDDVWERAFYSQRIGKNFGLSDTLLGDYRRYAEAVYRDSLAASASNLIEYRDAGETACKKRLAQAEAGNFVVEICADNFDNPIFLGEYSFPWVLVHEITHAIPPPSGFELITRPAFGPGATSDVESAAFCFGNCVGIDGDRGLSNNWTNAAIGNADNYAFGASILGFY
jgi:RHS repeat-associated protein